MSTLKKARKTLGKARFKALATYKKVYQSIGPAFDGAQRLLFISGAQRSGTTMLLRIFERDLHVKVFGEFSVLSNKDANGIRLNPLAEVAANLKGVRVPFVVMKPLVETQRLHEMFAALPHARSLWMYRHYRDVASSNLVRFGATNGLDDIRPMATGEAGNWRSEGVSPEVRATIAKHFKEDMAQSDAAALFWWARNMLYFDLKLEQDPRILLMDYNALVTSPAMAMRRIYKHAGAIYPGRAILADVSKESVGKGKKFALSPEVEKLCEVMLARLKAADKAQPSAPKRTVRV